MSTIINPITTVLLNRTELESGEFDRFPFKYILEDDGTIAYFSKLSAGRFVLNHEVKIPGLGRIKNSKPPVSTIQPLAHGNKIPGDMFKQVRKFFLDVMAMGPGTYEAQIFIVWSDLTSAYRIVVPKQTVSAAAVKYDIGELLSNTDTIICDIHSHNDMNAFFSGTDNNDDKKNPWISGVFGKLSTNMENKFRFNDGCGRHFDMKSEDVFDFGDDVATPSEWLSQVSLAAVATRGPSKITSWDDAFGMAKPEDDLWSSPAKGKLGGGTDYSWAEMFDPSSDLYDSIVDVLNDADNSECRNILCAVKDAEDHGGVTEHTLTDRELLMFIEISHTCNQANDKSMVMTVLDELINNY